MMDAVEFLKEAKRYCKWCKNTTEDGKRRLCEVCYFEKLGEIFSLPTMAYRKFVETVEEWEKEHPIKTRQSEFLKMFPNAEFDLIGKVLSICPHSVDCKTACRYNNEVNPCIKCRYDYWLKEVE